MICAVIRLMTTKMRVKSKMSNISLENFRIKFSESECRTCGGPKLENERGNPQCHRCYSAIMLLDEPVELARILVRCNDPLLKTKVVQRIAEMIPTMYLNLIAGQGWKVVPLPIGISVDEPKVRAEMMIAQLRTSGMMVLGPQQLQWLLSLDDLPDDLREGIEQFKEAHSALFETVEHDCNCPSGLVEAGERVLYLEYAFTSDDLDRGFYEDMVLTLAADLTTTQSSIMANAMAALQVVQTLRASFMFPNPEGSDHDAVHQHCIINTASCGMLWQDYFVQAILAYHGKRPECTRTRLRNMSPETVMVIEKSEASLIHMISEKRIQLRAEMDKK